MQLLVPWLAALTGMNMWIGWNPSGWMFNVNSEGKYLYDGPHFLALLLIFAVPAVGLISFTVPFMRLVYKKALPTGTVLRPEDERSMRLSIAWFLGSMILPVLVTVAIIALASATSPLVGCALFLGQAVLGGLTAWLALAAIGAVGTAVFRKESLGFGDLTFLAPIGCLLGPVGTFEAIFLAAFIGSLVGVPLLLMRAKQVIPFGPFLACGSLAMLLFGAPLHHRAMQVIAPSEPIPEDTAPVQQAPARPAPPVRLVHPGVDALPPPTQAPAPAPAPAH